MTEYLKVDPESPAFEPIERAARVLREGGLVAFPTETVYGLGAAATIPSAVEALRAVKERPDDKPFTILLSHPAQVAELVEAIPPRAQALINRYWPGPLTLVLEGVEGRGPLGLRVPAHPVARLLVHAAGIEVYAPSANPSGAPPATTAEEVRAYFDGKIDVVIDAGPSPLKESSTVVQIDGDSCDVLREGIITSAMIHQLVSGKTILFVCSGNTCRSPMAEVFFRKHLAKKLGKDADELEEVGYRIASAGIMASWGSRASLEAERAVGARGCSLARHVSRPLTPELLREADRVFAMTGSQIEALERLEPAVADRIALLGGVDVSDPFGGSPEIYEECAEEIEAAVIRLVASF